MTQSQWKCALEWTRNLVANPLQPVEDDLDELRHFRTELQGKAEGNVDFSTIPWIWDEFARLTPAGKEYQRFGEQMLEQINRVGPPVPVIDGEQAAWAELQAGTNTDIQNYLPNR
jgi:hypothetical protein